MLHGVREFGPYGIAGFSPAASGLAAQLINASDIDSGETVPQSGDSLRKAVGLEPEALNDAVEELSDAGLLKVLRAIGTAPYRFYKVSPTYALYRDFAQSLEYDPNNDARVVAAAIASRKSARPEELLKETGLTVGRLNRAVSYLEEYGIVDMSMTIPRYPYGFDSVKANHKTRPFVEAPEGR